MSATYDAASLRAEQAGALEIIHRASRADEMLTPNAGQCWFETGDLDGVPGTWPFALGATEDGAVVLLGRPHEVDPVEASAEAMLQHPMEWQRLD